MSVEREIKLRFASVAEARQCVLAAGAVPLRARRRQLDTLFDTADGTLAQARSVLRVRVEDGQGFVTFKGPVLPGVMKVREEIETPVGDAGALIGILEALAFRAGFKYEKYREEFQAAQTIVAVDETPVGVFVEIEGDEAAVHALARGMDRTPADYITDSYRALFLKDGEGHGDMLFARQSGE